MEHEGEGVERIALDIEAAIEEAGSAITFCLECGQAGCRRVYPNSNVRCVTPTMRAMLETRERVEADVFGGTTLVMDLVPQAKFVWAPEHVGKGMRAKGMEMCRDWKNSPAFIEKIAGLDWEELFGQKPDILAVTRDIARSG